MGVAAIVDTQPVHLSLYTITPPKRLPVDIPPYPSTVLRPDDFSSEATFIRLLGQAIALAILKNDNEFAYYSLACKCWQEAFEWYKATGVPMPDRPRPPKAWSVALISGVNVYRAVETDAPLAEPCSDPVLPPPPSSYVGNHIYGDYWASLPGDPTKDGVVVIDPKGLFVMLRSPFGGWYLKKG